MKLFIYSYCWNLCGFVPGAPNGPRSIHALVVASSREEADIILKRDYANDRTASLFMITQSFSEKGFKVNEYDLSEGLAVVMNLKGSTSLIPTT